MHKGKIEKDFTKIGKLTREQAIEILENARYPKVDAKAEAEAEQLDENVDEGINASEA
jgi:hypothetical protein